MFKPKSVTTFILLLLISVDAKHMYARQNISMHTFSKYKQSTLLSVLVNLGKTHDRYFTIETGTMPSEAINQMEAFLVNDDVSNGGTFQQKLAILKKEVPNFSYEINKTNPQIIHIIDSRLLQQKEYALEGVIKAIDFRGNSRELIDLLGKQKFSIALPLMMDISEMLYKSDLKTVVRIKKVKLKVRAALSNFTPLKGHYEILWVARTKLGKSETSYIQFRGANQAN